MKKPKIEAKLPVVKERIPIQYLIKNIERAGECKKCYYFKKCMLKDGDSLKYCTEHHTVLSEAKTNCSGNWTYGIEQ